MKMKVYLIVWVLILLVVGVEYYALNFQPQNSILLSLQKKGILSDSISITSEPGRPISLWLGWIGLTLMITMNVYSLRKRVGYFQNWGRLSQWLNFHVFCGLVGPTLILFHCNFKVRGLVGISFWSMVISFSSGIIGRYFYVQMLQAKVDFEKEAEKRILQLKTILEKNKIQVIEEEVELYIKKALHFVGVPAHAEINPFSAFFLSSWGDIKLTFQQPSAPGHWPRVSKKILALVAIQKRRALFLESFQNLMGYWHTFHFPFAVFMYIAAAIHVAAALVFGI